MDIFQRELSLNALIVVKFRAGGGPTKRACSGVFLANHPQPFQGLFFVQGEKGLPSPGIEPRIFRFKDSYLHDYSRQLRNGYFISIFAVRLETSNKFWLDHILFLIMAFLGVVCLE